MKFLKSFTPPHFSSTFIFLVVIIIAVCFLCAPFPYLQTADSYCQPCMKKPGYKCPPCPQKGDIVWGDSIATQLVKKNTETPPIDSTYPIDEGADPTPRIEKLPWENSTCGNGICELCESSDSCCNYPPQRDKNGTMIYPPPTCMGQCAEDCPEKSKGRYVEGQVIVKFKKGVSYERVAMYIFSMNPDHHENISLRDDPNTVKGRLELDHPVVVLVPKGVESYWVQEFLNSNIVEYAELDNIMTIN